MLTMTMMVMMMMMMMMMVMMMMMTMMMMMMMMMFAPLMLTNDDYSTFRDQFSQTQTTVFHISIASKTRQLKHVSPWPLLKD